MNNPHLQQHHHHHNGGNNGTTTLAITVEPKKESIEIKTEALDEGSNNTHTPPATHQIQLAHIQQHALQQHQQQLASTHNNNNNNNNNHQQPQAIAAAHHQILTTNGHIITNFLDLNNHHLHHIDYGKH